jgi:hypothetical protein
MPRVALVMHGSAMLYEAAIASEVFGVDRSDLSPSGEWYDLDSETHASLLELVSKHRLCRGRGPWILPPVGLR